MYSFETNSDQRRKKLLIKIKTVIELTGLSRATVYRKMEDGTFPKSVKLSTRAIAWHKSDIEAWIESLPTSGSSILEDRSLS